METVEGRPRDAVSAASNILELIFKTYIEDNKLPMPDKEVGGKIKSGGIRLNLKSRY